MTYRIAINQMALTGKIPPGDARWGRFNDSFVNKELEQIDIVNAIYTGHSYAAWHSGRRCVDNFQCAQHIAVDLETGDEHSTVEYLTSIDFVRIYGGLVYTTPSHTAADPRARVVFFLDQPIINASAYKAAAGFIYSLFPGSDSSCVDASRFFYGSKDCRIEWIHNTLPVAHLRRYYSCWALTKEPSIFHPQPVTSKTERQTETTDEEQPTPDAIVEMAIREAGSGSRNNRGYRLARQLKALGLSQFEAGQHMRRYQQGVERTGQHNYTEHEAMITLKSAYARTQAAHL